VDYLWAVLLSLVPRRYRAASSLEGSTQLLRAAAICGALQIIIFSFLFIGAFITESTGIWENASETVLNNIKGPSMDPNQVRLTTGTMGLSVFLLDPWHMFLAYMTVEGAIRAFAAAVLSKELPTLPLGIVAAVHSTVGGRKSRKEAAIIARDIVQAARDKTYDLLVLTNQQKPEWGPYTGIEYRGQLYLLDGEETAAAPRPFGYRLRKNPEGNLVPVVNKYNP
jgi:uncharacterized SAM-binding protein YcdF (DUF218 family)